MANIKKMDLKKAKSPRDEKVRKGLERQGGKAVAGCPELSFIDRTK